MKKYLIIMLLIGASTILSASKNPYQELKTTDGVKISYKWGKSNILKKDAPLRLLLKFENTNEYAVEVSFKIDFFWQGMIQSESENEKCICISPGKKLKGRVHDLHFDTGKFNNQQVKSDDFILEINDIKITQISGCKDYKTKSAK